MAMMGFLRPGIGLLDTNCPYCRTGRIVAEWTLARDDSTTETKENAEASARYKTLIHKHLTGLTEVTAVQLCGSCEGVLLYVGATLVFPYRDVPDGGFVALPAKLRDAAFKAYQCKDFDTGLAAAGLRRVLAQVCEVAGMPSSKSDASAYIAFLAQRLSPKTEASALFTDTCASKSRQARLTELYPEDDIACVMALAKLIDLVADALLGDEKSPQ